VTWIAGREYFSIRYFVETDKETDKNRDNARNRGPYAASEITSKYFAIQANISMRFSLFPVLHCSTSPYPPVPVRGAIRDPGTSRGQMPATVLESL